MSLILLDTHVLIWLFEGSDRLGPKTIDLIRKGCAEESVFISAITPWEIAMLAAKSRLTLKHEIDDWMNEVFNDYGISLVPLLPRIAIDSTRLAGAFHSDPADRIIVATAKHMDAVLITEDRLILNYAAQQNLKAIKADQ